MTDPSPEEMIDTDEARRRPTCIHLGTGTTDLYLCKRCAEKLWERTIRLADEIDRLRKENTRLALGQPAVEANRKLVEENTRLREEESRMVDVGEQKNMEIALLREALEFYADEDYEEWPRGSRARAALKKK